MTSISNAFGVSQVFSVPIDQSCKDSTSDSSKKSRRESGQVMGAEEAVSSKHSVESFYEDPLMHDEGLLESYTKIWESFSNERDCNSSRDLYVNQKTMSKSPILTHSTPFYPSRVQVSLTPEMLAPSQLSFKFKLQLTNQLYQNSPSNDEKNGQYLSDLASWITKSFSENTASSLNHLQEMPSSSNNHLSPWWSLSGDSQMRGLPPRAKANSFGYQPQSNISISNNSNTLQNNSKNGVGAQISRTQVKQSGKVTPPTRLYLLYQKLINPEDEASDIEENWEEDTTDTEIMKNINSLLDSGNPSSPQLQQVNQIDLFDYKEEALMSKHTAAFANSNFAKGSTNSDIVAGSCINDQLQQLVL